MSVESDDDSLSGDGDTETFSFPKMTKVVKDVTDTQKFYVDTIKYRQQDKKAEVKLSQVVSVHGGVIDELPPVFNKRLFASQGAVVLTPEARRLMRKNAKTNTDEIPNFMSKSELLAMRAVVEGLKLIHKAKDYIKDCLSHVITYESYGPWQYVAKKPYEDCISCYYIVNGAVEVTYGINVTGSKHVYQPNIIYNHGSGEYLGLVSPEGRHDDLAPPVTIYTKEACEFLRIDRTKFHKLIAGILKKEDREKRDYLTSGLSILSLMLPDIIEKVLPKLLKQEYPPNRTIINQDETADDFYIILSGRCNAFRQVYVPETEGEVNFFMVQLTTGNFFAEECVLERRPSVCTVRTTCHTICYKMHRSGLEIVSKEYLANILMAHRNQYPSDGDLQDRGYSSSIWNQYKYKEVKGSLMEGRRSSLLSTKHRGKVVFRPPGPRELRRENMYRFVLKGSEMQPVRVRSAVNRSVSRMSLPMRSKSAMDPLIDEDSSQSESDSSDIDSLPEMPPLERRASRQLIPAVARVLEKHQKTITESKDKKWAARRKLSILTQEIDKVGAANSAELYKFLQENEDLTKQFKNAWIDDMERETIERNFMDNGVLVSMDSDDIVRKAKAIADNFADKVKPKKTTSLLAQEEDWETLLHTENKQAKVCIALSKYRTETLRSKITELQRRRAKERTKGRISFHNISEDDKENGSKKIKGFLLEKLVDGQPIDNEEGDVNKSKSIAGVLMVGQAVQKFKRFGKMGLRRNAIGTSFERIVNENKPSVILEEDEEDDVTVESRRRPSSAVTTRRDLRQLQTLEIGASRELNLTRPTKGNN